CFFTATSRLRAANFGSAAGLRAGAAAAGAAAGTADVAVDVAPAGAVGGCSPRLALIRTHRALIRTHRRGLPSLHTLLRTRRGGRLCTGPGGRRATGRRAW